MLFPIGDDNSMRRTTPFVVFGLIAANAVMWWLQLTSGEAFTYGFSAVPYEITHGTDLLEAALLETPRGPQAVPHYPGPSPIHLTLLTSMFMHGSWMHLLGNMLYLWIFGDQIEDLLGHFRFIAFYLVCGVLAAFAQILSMPDSVIPTLGASGAIAGVLGAYLVKYPHNRVRVLVWRTILHMPAVIVLGFWIVLQFISQAGVPAGSGGGVAYWAHIGGFLAGMALILVLARGKSTRGLESGWRRRRRGMYG
ncbi:MAG TPA: rhomboid family intramembrane serine protease [Fibrobacteria bacterium]|nr:rhomboid family intramembrane serine protease [Fibrobacteria bacterium]